MQKLFLLLLALSLCNPNVLAQDWVEIAPMPEYCPEFKIEYKYEQGFGYEVRYRPYSYDLTQPRPYYTFPKPLDDINNLSALTDELNEAVYMYCPNTYLVEHPLGLEDEKIMCIRPKVEDPFGVEYAELLKAMIVNKKDGKTHCKDVIPLIELQKSISHLRSEDLLNFNESGNILRLFVGEQSDELIDHFKACGGKKGTKQFIKNLVILEAKKACLFPAPPGLLSFEKTLKVAEEIANDYPNMSLLKLNSQQDNMIKNSLLKFVDVIFTEQIESLLGKDYPGTQDIIENLDSIKKLKNEKGNLIQDHVQYILPLNATLEIVDVGLPLIIKENFAGILPDDMTKNQKDEFINNVIIPAVSSDYNKCIADIKERIEYPSTKSSKEIIKDRKALELEFCSKNIEECRDPDCGSIKNLLTDRKDITDMTMVQACVFKSFSTALYPTLEKIVASQKATISEYINFDDETISDVARSAYATLHACTDSKIKQRARDNNKNREMKFFGPFDKDIEPLYHISSGEFIDIIEICSNETEEAQVKDFISVIIDSIDLVRETYGNGKKRKMMGSIEIDEGSYAFSQKIIEKTIPDCLKLQRYRNLGSKTDYSVSTLNCTPLIEIEAAAAILNATVEDTLKEYNIPIENNPVMEKFNKCALAMDNPNSAKNDVYDALFNPQHPNKIIGGSDADNYLKSNHKFYECVKDVVLDLADVGGSAVLDDALKKVSNELSDINYFKKLIPQIKAELSACFNKKLEELGSWPNFLQYNEKGGLDELENECSEVAIEYALPKVIGNEINLQIKDLESIELINKSESKQVLRLLNSSIIAEYKLKDVNSADTKAVIKAAYISYRKAHPEAEDALGDFVNAFTKTAEPVIIDSIAALILEDVVKTAAPKHDLSLLPQSLTPKCIAEHFLQNKEAIYKLIDDFDNKEDSDSNESYAIRETFVDIIREGALRAKEQNRYGQFLQNLKLVCSSPKKYKDLNKMINMGLGDDVIMSQMQPILLEEFLGLINEQCKEALAEQNLKKLLTKDEQDLVCHNTKTSNKDIEALKAKLFSKLKDPKSRSMLDLILYRKAKSQELIVTKFNDKEFLDRTFLKQENRDFINFVYNNIGKIILEDEKTNEKLTLMATEAIFKDTSENSFAELFVESQLIYEIGSSQFDDINKKVVETTNNINWKNSDLKEYLVRDRIRKKAEVSFGNIWNYNNIKEYLAFDYVEKYKKQALVKQVVDLGVKVQIDKSLSPAQKAANSERLEQKVTDYMDKLDKVPNPAYDPTRPEYNKKTVWMPYLPTVTPIPIPERVKVKDNPQYLNVEDRVNYDVTEEITKQVKDDIGNDIESLKKGFNIYLKTVPRLMTPIIPMR